MSICVGVLALQGDVAEHCSLVESLDQMAKEVRTAEDLSSCDALIIPGGESTTIMKLMQRSGLDQAIINRVEGGMPVLGTCAGAIVLSRSHLGLIDIEVERNAYGSQKESFRDNVTIDDIGDLEVAFIRAPKITAVGDEVSVLSTHRGSTVCVRQGMRFATTFHPEVTGEAALHTYFVGCVQSALLVE